MTRLFMTGLEAGHLGVFDAVNSAAAISSAQARTGTYSLNIPSSSDYVQVNLPATVTGGLYVQVAVYPTGEYNDGGIVGTLDSDGDVGMVVAIDEGMIKIYRGSTSYIREVAQGAVNENAWNLIEVYFLQRNTDGRCIVRVNGNVVIDHTGDTVPTGGQENIAQVRFGAAYSVHATYGYYDDMIINDTAGAVNNSWPGGAGISPLTPNGAGSYSELTPSAGDNYSCMDDVPPDDDTSYVGSDVEEEIDTYEMTAPTLDGRIGAVQWLCRAKANSEGTTYIEPVTSPGSGADIGTPQLVTTGYAYYKEIMEANPDDSAAWETADLADIEVGLRVGANE